MKKEKLKDPGKRKMLLVLPVFIIPFLTMAFWAMGGGKADGSTDQKNVAGLNLDLPNAQLKDDKGENKLSYYEQAEKDSAKWREGMEKDPFFPSGLNDTIPGKRVEYDPYTLQAEGYKDPNEQKVFQKLAELNTHLQNPDNYNNRSREITRGFSNSNPSFNKEDVDRLETMMNRVSSPATRDQEVDQLNGMMDRILDIQHPERVKQRLNEISSKNKEDAFDAHRINEHFTISLLDTNKTSHVESNAFFGADNKKEDKESNAIEAVIHETQTLVDGSVVKMRLMNDIIINGMIIPVGNFVFGKASLEGERLHIDINSIRKGNSLYPVKLAAFDLDGMEGVYTPGAITRDVAKQSADNSLQNIEMTSLDPSLKMQATNAGIHAAKTLLSKKARIVKMTVKGGYKILLKGISQ